jgi:hypothetical protein
MAQVHTRFSDELVAFLLQKYSPALPPLAPALTPHRSSLGIPGIWLSPQVPDLICSPAAVWGAVAIRSVCPHNRRYVGNQTGLAPHNMLE